MASLNVMKMKKGMLGGLKVHLDNEARLTHGHSNKHINKELTKDNFCINCRTFSEGLNKIENCIKRVDEAIPPKRIRADRVTTVAIEFKIPEEISKQNRDKEFAEKCIDYLTHRLGVPGMIGFGHKDEKHTYVDPLTHEERESLNHVHAYCPCYTEEHGINAKHFFGVNNLNYAELNREFDAFVRQEFGIEYMTQNECLGLDVENLKKLSESTAKHDNELKAELGIHQSLIDSGQAPTIEAKESIMSDTVKIAKSDYDMILNDMRYHDSLKKQEYKYRKMIKELKNENAELKQKVDNTDKRINQINRLNEEYVESHQKAIKMLCEKHSEDYDRIQHAINQDKCIGHSHDIQHAINPELSEKITKKITHHMHL